MRSLALALALATPAGAADEVDLPDMQKAYGFRAVASVVTATAASDLAPVDVHEALRKSGLDRLKMPVRLADAAARARFGEPEPLGGCGWSWGDVVCGFSVPARLGTWNTHDWGVACLDREGRATDVVFEVRLRDAVEPGDTAWIDVWDVARCWSAGGVAVGVRGAPPGPA